jgi:hypothetical protein
MGNPEMSLVQVRAVYDAVLFTTLASFATITTFTTLASFATITTFTTFAMFALFALDVALIHAFHALQTFFACVLCSSFYALSIAFAAL